MSVGNDRYFLFDVPKFYSIIVNWGAKVDWDFRISDLVKNPAGTDI